VDKKIIKKNKKKFIFFFLLFFFPKLNLIFEIEIGKFWTIGCTVI